MKNKIFLILLALLVFIAQRHSVNFLGLADSPWPMFHGNPHHTGLSPYDTSHVDGTVQWSFEAGAGIESSPAIGVDGTIYFGSHDCKLYALYPDGSEKWHFQAGDPVYNEIWDVWKGIMSSPAIASDGTIYFSSAANFLFAINPDGTEKWRFFVKWHNDFWSSPAVGPDGTIYIGSARNDGAIDFPSGLYAIYPDGTEKWRYLITSGVTTSPAVGSDGTIFVAAADAPTNLGKVYAIYPSGIKKWEFTTEYWMESSPALGSDGTIYIGSGRESKVYAIYPDGTEKWRFLALDGVSATPAIGADGTIYIGSWDYNLYALYPDGTEKWSFQTPASFEGVSSSAAIGSDGTIYVGSNSGNFYAINPDGTEKWHFYSNGGTFPASPAIGSDGTIYIGSYNHKLYSFGGPPPVNTIYPPFSFSGKRVLNRSLSQNEYINVLTWQANPNNIDITKYRIYLATSDNIFKKGRSLSVVRNLKRINKKENFMGSITQNVLIELNADTFKYWHRNVDKEKVFTYAIVAVDDEGREGIPAYVTVQ